ncbi:MAG: polyamine aminopropyltransferase, partial [Deltaproteobacteria bacterium]|nr:polyamine aminopropyltransferase [Deltaproteobacteria bacterium]
MSEKEEWATEKWKDVEIRYRINKIIQEIETDYQHLTLVDSCKYGRMLLLDGIVQTTEKDEFIYHEMMTHVPMMLHPKPENVLIIGGGDGGVLREVLKYDTVEKATLVEIDQSVISFCKEYLPTVSNGAFEDKRSEIVIDDGSAFLKKKKNSYDIVIVDSSDPIGPAEKLFSREFYKSAHDALNPDGIMVHQTGSIHMQSDEQPLVYGLIRHIFQYHAFYVYSVPTYIGGLFSSVLCSDSTDPGNMDMEEILKKFDSYKLNTKYYNPGIHFGSFHIPSFLYTVY